MWSCQVRASSSIIAQTRPSVAAAMLKNRPYSRRKRCAGDGGAERVAEEVGPRALPEQIDDLAARRREPAARSAQRLAQRGRDDVHVGLHAEVLGRAAAVRTDEPEDLGLVPDQAVKGPAGATAEPTYTRQQAMRTRAFWMLALFTVLVYPVQAGVSLHQAPHLIERGLSPELAATVIGVFSAMSAVASLCVGFLPRRWPVRGSLASAAILMAIGAFGLIRVHGPETAFAFAGQADGYVMQAAGIVLGCAIPALIYALTRVAAATYIDCHAKS